MFSRVPIYKSHWFLIGLVFAFFLLVSPVSALVFQDVGKYCSGGKESCTGAAAYRWVGTDALVTSSVGDGMYLVYFMPNKDSTSRSCWAGYTSGWSLSSNCAGASYKFGQWVDRNGAAYYIYYNPTNDIGAWTGNITAQFTGTPTSGYSPLTVTFTDESAGNPTSWEWDFGDNSTHVTTQNATHQYVNSGLYTVKLTASKSGSSDISTRTDYITVNSWVAPVAAFSCSPTNTTSPVVVTCTDSTSNNPTGWLWHLTSYGVSMSPGGSYGAGIYDAVNSTQNPVFNMEGSGTVDVRLTASNPAGSSQEYKPAYITIAGVAPTPTSTPNIPWPNQTGVCWRSGISLGSQQVREFYVHYQLTDPQGDTYSGQYYPGEVNIISGQPFFTAVTGLYIYNEYSMVDGSLLWRQSYVVEDCTVTPTVTPTTTNVFPTPSVTYTIPPTYPTVSIPPTRYMIPPTVVPYPTMIKPTVVIQPFPTLSLDFNSSELYNFTITVSPISKPIVSWLRTWIDSYLKTAIASFLALTVSPFTYIVSGIPQSTTQLVSGLISFAAYPFAILYAIGVFVRNMPEKVRIVFALLLWSNIVFYYFDFFKRGAR